MSEGNKKQARRKPLPQKVKDELYLDYLAGISHQELSEKYDININSLYRLIEDNGWAKKRKELRSIEIANIEVSYVNAQAELLDVYYKDLYKLLAILQDQIHHHADTTFLVQAGAFSYQKFQQAVESYMNIMAALNQITGAGLTVKDVEELRYKYAQLDLKKLLAGLALEEATSDNFMEVLAESLAKLGD